MSPTAKILHATSNILVNRRWRFVSRHWHGGLKSLLIQFCMAHQHQWRMTPNSNVFIQQLFKVHLTGACNENAWSEIHVWGEDSLGLYYCTNLISLLILTESCSTQLMNGHLTHYFHNHWSEQWYTIITRKTNNYMHSVRKMDKIRSAF